MFDLFFVSDTSFEWERDSTWGAIEADIDVRDSDYLLDLTSEILAGEILDADDVVNIDGEFEYFSDSVVDIVAIGFGDIAFDGVDDGILDANVDSSDAILEGVIGAIADVDAYAYELQDFIGIGTESLDVDTTFPEVEFEGYISREFDLDVDAHNYMSVLFESSYGLLADIDCEAGVFYGEFEAAVARFGDLDIDVHEMSVLFESDFLGYAAIDCSSIEFDGEFWGNIDYLGEIDIETISTDAILLGHIKKKYYDNIVLVHRRHYDL